MQIVIIVHSEFLGEIGKKTNKQKWNDDAFIHAFFFMKGMHKN